MLEEGPKFKRALRIFDFLFVLVIVCIVAIFFSAVLGYKEPIEHKMHEAQASGLNIYTDKQVYKAGESVKVKMANYSSRTMSEQFEPALEIQARKDFGKNYGVAMIEKKVDNAWLAVEPLWRCSGDCRQACDEKKSLDPKITNIFLWDQNFNYCNSTGEITIQSAGFGEYRISAANIVDFSLEPTIIYSNIFIIK
jgi:hypothetical protein